MHSIEMIEIVAKSLDSLIKEIVFIGGAATSLYSNQNNKLEFRPTEDVDCIINVTSKLEFYALENKLRSLGFENNSTMICRWNVNGIVVDIMPTDANILGFTNSWYQPGLENKIQIKLPSKKNIYIFTLPYFLASKFEALYNRGDNDWRVASDLEDILLVVISNINSLDKINNSENKVRNYLVKSFSDLLSQPNINEILISHVKEEAFQKSKTIIENISKL